jgi:antitoxin ParD1/3/4
MGKFEKISIALTDEMLASVEQAVASGDYASSSEVVRHALRNWKKQRDRDISYLHELVYKGLKGPFEPYEGIDEIKAEGRRRLAELRK